MQTVKVTNRNNTFWMRDKYGGVEYKFPCGDTVTIPAEAAEHIFGYGLNDKDRFKKFMRAGLANHPKGKQIWDNMVIKPVTVGARVEPTGVVREATP